MSEILQLVRGKTYTFSIVNPAFAQNIFIISSDPGGGIGTEISVGVVNVWELENGKVWTGSVNLTSSGEAYTGVIYDSATSLQLDKVELRFTPSDQHADTIYYQSLTNTKVGGQISLLDNVGAVINDEELNFIMGIQQTNRTYNFKYYTPFLTNFLNMTLPANVRGFFFNKAPEIQALYSDKTSYIGGTDTALISGLIFDAENDILRYKWVHTAPLISVGTQADLTSTIDDDTTLNASVILTQPPVGTLYKMQLTVSDTEDNIADTLDLVVSGQYVFSTWGDTDFVLGDCGLPFSYLT